MVHGDLALPMFVALGVLLFSGLPIAFVLIGVGAGFGLLGYGLGAVRLTDFGAIYHRIYGTLADAEDIGWSAVPLLIFMGALLHESGAARELMLRLQAVLARAPGGLGIAALLIGVLLAPSAGMVGATVGTLALVAIPAMLEHGYAPRLAAGSVAAAGAIGVTLPPGVMLFFLADAMGMQVPFIFFAMVGPALVLLALNAGYLAIAAPAGGACRALPARSLLRGLIAPCALLALVLAAVLAGWATLSESAALGAAGALLLAAWEPGQRLLRLHRAIARTAIMTGMVFLVFVGASVFALMFRTLGGVDRVGALLAALGLADWGKLALVLGTIFLLGCFLDWIEIVVISFAVFRPVLDAMDFAWHVGTPYLASGWITILVALALQTSFLTPPFGYALLFVRGAAPVGVRMADIYRGAVPFVAIQLAALVCVAAFPQLVTWLPGQFLDVSVNTRGVRFSE